RASSYCCEREPKMGEIVLTFVVEEMLKKLASLAFEGIDLAWGFKGKLQKLKDSQLKEGLQGKKFLLVLDDVWNEERDKWESLKKCLSIVSGSNGNASVIVTTRKQQIASIMETSPGHRHELKGLKDEECWSIIRNIVESGNDKASISGNLEAIGKAIATKCGGVPLAAKMLGGLMRKSIEERHWRPHLTPRRELLKKVASLSLEGIVLAWGLKRKLQKLKDSLTFIQAVLNDAVGRQARGEESIKIWLQKLRDVAYDAEDVLDEFGYEVLRQKVEGSTPNKKLPGEL
ncbi:hypothetical protein Tsubulata_028466, partial [Turnera subulata]